MQDSALVLPALTWRQFSVVHGTWEMATQIKLKQAAGRCQPAFLRMVGQLHFREPPHPRSVSPASVSLRMPHLRNVSCSLQSKQGCNKRMAGA